MASAPLFLPEDHLGIYVHVPFCVRKCRYCDFPSQPLDDDDALVERYLDALAREAALRRRECDRPAHSIFIGGGTPSILTPAQFTRLWHEVIAPFPRLPAAEITVEANPGTLTDAFLTALTALPVTRVSLGAQSLCADELALLGRIHTPGEVAAGVAAVRAAGIPQLNIDLMYALPGQTPAQWHATLDAALALRPDHLSCYALLLEDETPLTAEVAAGTLPAPGEEEEASMWADTAEALARAGYDPYEVSNAAQPGAHCRHNLGYWLGRDYLGIGPAATSALGAVRWRNERSVEQYVTRLADGRSAIAYVERLSAPERLLEQVMLGLRLRAGFDLVAAESACGCALAQIAGPALAHLVETGLLEQADGWLCLTPRGYPLANRVVTRLMAALERRADD